jgi:hypothetical protein
MKTLGYAIVAAAALAVAMPAFAEEVGINIGTGHHDRAVHHRHHERAHVDVRHDRHHNNQAVVIKRD